MTPRRQIIRGAARVAGAVASYAANQAGKYMAAKAYNKLTNFGKPKKKSSKKSRGPPDVSHGVYAGKFNRRYTRKYNVWEVMSRYGHTQKLESYGVISDPDLVGFVHSTYCLNPIARLIAKIVVRTVFAKVGVNPASVEEALPPLYTGSTVELHYLTGGTASILVHTVTSTDGIADVAATFANIFVTAMTSGVEHVFTSISLGSTTISIVQMSLDNMVFTIKSTSNVKLQNRTKGAEATGSDADRVDNQPIVGYSVRCSGAVPRVRIGTSGNTARIPIRIGTNGPTDTIVGSTLDTNDREPLMKSYFTNSIASRKLMLQPGSIRSSSITHSWSGYFNNFFKSFKVSTDLSEIVGGPGKSEVFTLEEILNTGSSNNIQLAVENEYTVGGYLKQGKKRSMRIEHGTLGAL